MDAFVRMGRKENFSYDGLRALFAHLEEMEDACGEEIELDVVALCCEYSEYASAVECLADLGSGYMEREHNEESALESLQENTVVIEMENGGIIIANF